MNQNEIIFEYGGTSKKLIFPILMGFFSSSAIVFISLLNSMKFIHPFFIIATLFFSATFIFFFFIIPKKLSHSSEIPQKVTKTSNISNVFIPIHSNNSLEILPGEDKLKLFLMILPLCLFEYSSTLCSSVLRETNVSFLELIIKVLLIVFTTGLSSLILKYRYHKHHLVAVIILLIGVVIFTILEFVYGLMNIPKESTIIAKYFFLSILYQLITSLQECFEKCLMEKKFVHPHVLVSFEGFTGTICLIISFFVLKGIDCPEEAHVLCNPDEKYNNKYENFIITMNEILNDFTYILIFIGLFISFMLYNVFRSLTNFNYSPAHRAIADNISFMLTWISKLLIRPIMMNKEHVNFGYYFFAIIALSIMMIAVSIYLEIIIVNVFGIGNNTQKKIEGRETNEKFNDVVSLRLTEQSDVHKQENNTSF